MRRNFEHENSLVEGFSSAFESLRSEDSFIRNVKHVETCCHD